MSQAFKKGKETKIQKYDRKNQKLEGKLKQNQLVEKEGERERGTIVGLNIGGSVDAPTLLAWVGNPRPPVVKG